MQTEEHNKQRQVFTLSQITESIARMFDKFYQNPYWIMAEISALNIYPTSGHCFPLMVEKSDGKVKAQLKATIWKDDLFVITQKFEEVTKEPLREGLSIMFLAYIKFSSTYGLSLQIIDVEPLFTLGEMARDKMNAVNQLRAEGVFLKNKQLELPLLFKHIAIISVASSKGYNDLMVTLQTNPRGYKINSVLFPAVMQGKGAAETIMKQLRNIHNQIHLFHAVVIVRGGGDDVGLSCYDDLNLARQIALFPIPVITGIGHSTNETIVEMVASINKITPTDVAHFLLSGFREQEVKLDTLQKSVNTHTSALLLYTNHNLRLLNSSFVELAANYLSIQKASVIKLADLLISEVNYLVFNNRVALSRYESSLLQSPRQINNREKALLLNHERRLLFNSRHILSANGKKIEDLQYNLRLLNPVNVLKRGYALIRINGKLPIDTLAILPGDELEVETEKLKLTGTVNQIHQK